MRNPWPLFVLPALAGCVYDPPPEVSLVAPPGGSFVKGDPVVLRFSEPVKTTSLEVRVWTGRKDRYDREGDLLPGNDPLLDTCSPVSSPCGPGAVAFTLDGTRTEASLLVPEGALGPWGDPLRLEVTGCLEDDRGHRVGVSRFFDFQIIAERWDPYLDTVSEDGATAADATGEPLEVRDGVHLFHAEFTEPLPLPQQFFSEVRINPDSGDFVWVMIDADPIPDAPPNTDDPLLLAPDHGAEGFIFTVKGRISRDPEDDDELIFDTEPFTLAQEISGIYFELQDMVMHGRITVDPREDRSRWDGTMAVSGVYMRVTATGRETRFDPTQANFQIFELLPAETPQDLPAVCEEDPCTHAGGKCDLLPGIPWPPAFVCDE